MKLLAHFGILFLLIAAISTVASRELSTVLASNTSGNQVVTITPSGLIPDSSNWRTVTPSTGSTLPTGTGSSGNISTASTSNTTANWAGYSAAGSNFTSVSGSWVVPNVSSNGEDSADAAWIGIGGVSSEDLIQTGTQDIVSADGQVQSSAFYELLPDTSQNISAINVNPGDSMTASIYETSEGLWSINIKDNTNGQSYTNEVSYDSSLSSAEWIQEDPSDGQSQIPFDNFGTIKFSNAKTTEDGKSLTIAGANGQALTMVTEDGTELATTSSLGTDGSSFSVSGTGSEQDQLTYSSETPTSIVRRVAVNIERFKANGRV